MANLDHTRELFKGVEQWNEWLREQREKDPCFCPDLMGAGLVGVNLADACLEGAVLLGANLEKASLHGARLGGAKLWEVRLRGADLGNADLRGAYLCSADLRNCNLAGAAYDRWGFYKGVRLDGAYGSQGFLRHARDQDFIEEFRGWDVDMRPWKWPWKRLLRLRAWRFWEWNWNVRTWRWRFFSLYLPWLVFADCGRSFLLWSAWSVLFALGFGAVYADHHFWGLLPQSAVPQMDPPTYDSWFSPYYFSIVTFTTLGFGDVTPSDCAAEFWVTAEVILGYVMLGGLISIFANKLARRSG